MLFFYSVALRFALQNGSAFDKLIDAFLSSPPGQIIFIGFVFAVIAIIVAFWRLAHVVDKSQTDFGKAYSEMIEVIKNLSSTMNGLQNYMNRAQDENCENYLMIKSYVEQYQTLFDKITLSLTSQQALAQQTLKAIADMLIQVVNVHAETRAQMQKDFKTALGLALEEMIDQRRADWFDDFRAPEPDDCRYEMKIVKSALNGENGEPGFIQLFIAPVLKDKNSAGQIRGSGEIVNVISELMFPGWSHIRQLYGENPLSGYVRTKNLIIMDLPSSTEKDSSHEQKKS